MNGEDLGVMKRRIIEYRQESSMGLWRETTLVCGCKLMAFSLAETSRTRDELQPTWANPTKVSYSYDKVFGKVELLILNMQFWSELSMQSSCPTFTLPLTRFPSHTAKQEGFAKRMWGCRKCKPETMHVSKSWKKLAYQ